MRNVVEYLNGAIESILNHHFDIASLAKEAREISKSCDYATIRKTALEKMKSAQEKYSKGTRYTAVSYTHLDVYKRQLLRLGRRRRHRALLRIYRRKRPLQGRRGHGAGAADRYVGDADHDYG